MHYCLGANLARAELQEALAFLAPRMPGLALDGEPEYGSIDGIYGLDALPIRWDGLRRTLARLRRGAAARRRPCRPSRAGRRAQRTRSR